MSNRVYNVSLQMDLKSLSAPGVYLCPKGKAFVRICVFGVSEVTKEVDPIFPLVFKERFNFSKVYNDMGSVYELHDKLGRSVITLELVQCPVGSTGCIKLAIFNALLSDILHPYATCFSKPSDTSGIELLFSKCKIFPGILAPKADVSIAVEVTDTFGEPTARGDTKGQVISKSMSEDKRRQQPVCHTKDNLRCTCFHDPQRRSKRPRKNNKGKETLRSMKPPFNSADHDYGASKPSQESVHEVIRQDSPESNLEAWPNWLNWSTEKEPQAKPSTARKSKTLAVEDKISAPVRRQGSTTSSRDTDVDDMYQEEMRRAMEDCDKLLKEYSSASLISDLDLKKRYINCLGKEKIRKVSDQDNENMQTSSSDSFGCSCLPNDQDTNSPVESGTSENSDGTPEYVQPRRTHQASKPYGEEKKSRQRPLRSGRSLESLEEGDHRTLKSRMDDHCSCIREKVDSRRSRTAGRSVGGPDRIEQQRSRTAGRSRADSRRKWASGFRPSSGQRSDEADAQIHSHDKGERSSAEEDCDCHRCKEYQRKYKPLIHPCPRFRKKQSQAMRKLSPTNKGQPLTHKESRKHRSTIQAKQSSTAQSHQKRSSRRHAIWESHRPKPSVPEKHHDRVPQKNPRGKLPPRPHTTSPYRRPEQGDVAHEERCECPHCEDYQKKYNPSKHPCPNFVKGSDKARRSSVSGPKKLISSRQGTGLTSQPGECPFSECGIPPDLQHHKAKRELKNCHWWD